MTRLKKPGRSRGDAVLTAGSPPFCGRFRHARRWATLRVMFAWACPLVTMAPGDRSAAVEGFVSHSRERSVRWVAFVWPEHLTAP